MLHRYKRPDRIKEWGQKLVQTKSHNKACVAVARKLAVVMHAMWIDGTSYHGAPESVPADVARKLLHHEAQSLAAAQ
jgi:transposase